jgi:hypothetical protein
VLGGTVINRDKLARFTIVKVLEDPFGHAREGQTLEELYTTVDNEIENRNLDAEFCEIRVKCQDGKYYRPVIKAHFEECDKPT